MAEGSGETKSNWIGFCRQNNLFYYVPAGVLAIITVVAAFRDEADAWPVLVLAGICILVPNLDRLQSIQVTTSGIMAELRKSKADADTLLETLRRSTIDTTAVSLELVQRSGWLGGFEEGVKNSIRESAAKRLKEAGVTDDEIERIMYRTWYRYDFYTYATCILGRVTVPDFGRPPPFNEEDPEVAERASAYISRIRAEWKALRDRWPNEPATPDELAAFIEKTGDEDAERQRLLAAYRYYLEHRTHLDMALWENRGKIPPIKVRRIVDDGQ
jgi:hypothetical protein